MMTPWSSYRIDLERAPVRLWNAFGRIQAHGETLREIRLTPDAAASLTRRWREPAAAATASILAGRDGTAAPFDGEIAAAIAALYGAIDDSIDRGLGNGAAFALRPEALCHDNTALAELAAAAGGADATADAGSMAAQFTEPATETWSRLGQFCRWLESPEFRATEVDALQIAFLRAFGAVFHLSLMRPFRLCSGATADLLGYRMLRLAGLPPMTAHLPARPVPRIAGRGGGEQRRAKRLRHRSGRRRARRHARTTFHGTRNPGRRRLAAICRHGVPRPDG
jgi:hypothetical protein